MGGIIKIIFRILFICMLQVNFVCAQEVDEFFLKLVANGSDRGKIMAVYTEDNIYVNILDVLEKLGYPYQYDYAQKGFEACCPSGEHCFKLNNHTVWLNKDSVGVQDSMDTNLIYAEGGVFVGEKLFGFLTALKVNLLFNSLKLEVDYDAYFPFEAQLNQSQRLEKFNSLKPRDLIAEAVDTIKQKKLRVNTIGYALGGSVNEDGISGYNVLMSSNLELLRGNAMINFTQSNSLDSKESQLNARQYYELNNRVVRQLSLFRSPSSILMSDLGGYVNGVYLSNDNKLFFNQRYYVYKSRSIPNSNIEIYNNNQLVSFITTDSVGYFEATIPVSVGENTISTVVINDFGENVSNEQVVFIAQDILTRKELRYQFSSGVSDANTFFSGVSVEYGITSFLTGTARLEVTNPLSRWTYLYGIGLKTSLSRAFQIGAEYYHQFKYNVTVSGYFSKYLGYNMAYDRYDPDQVIIPLLPVENLQGGFSLQIPGVGLQHSLSFNGRNVKYKNSELFNTTLRGNVFFRKLLLSFTGSSISRKSYRFQDFSCGAKAGYRFSEKFYNDLSVDWFSSNNNVSLQNRLQFKLFKMLEGNVSAMYQTFNRSFSVGLGVTWRIPYSTMKLSSTITDNSLNANASVEGSVRFYPNKSIAISNRNDEQAALHIALYVDKNGNKKYDKHEKILPQAKAILKTGAEIDRRKTGLYFRNITPSNSFTVIIPRQSFEDISWQVTPLEKNIYLYPGQSYSIYHPVQIISEISGQILADKYAGVQVANIVMQLTNISNNETLSVATDEWGEYYFSGVTTGEYILKPVSKDPDLIFDADKRISIPESDEGLQMDRVNFKAAKKYK